MADAQLPVTVAAQARECQADSFRSASHPVPRIVDLGRRTMEQFRRAGLTSTLRKMARFLCRRETLDLESGALPSSHVSGFGDEVLDLQIGEQVQVRSWQEILRTLDEHGTLHGLAFLPNMRQFCGQRFVVFRRMETLYSEETGKVRRLKHTVLLSGVQCDGLLMKCDRSCYLYWREAWLKRVEAA